MTKALLLDRDGIVNKDLGYVFQKSEFIFNPGIFELCTWAQSQQYLLIIITNQSGIARGLYREQDLHELHRYMKDEFKVRGISITDIYYCPHHPDFTGSCLCRKPGSLLFEKAVAAYSLNPSLCWALGDKCRDIQAARALGCKTILVGPDPCTEMDYRVADIREVKKLIE